MASGALARHANLSNRCRSWPPTGNEKSSLATTLIKREERRMTLV